MAAVAADAQAARLAEEVDVEVLAVGEAVMTQPFPHDGLPAREIEADLVRVRRLLVVLVAVANKDDVAFLVT